MNADQILAGDLVRKGHNFLLTGYGGTCKIFAVENIKEKLRSLLV